MKQTADYYDTLNNNFTPNTKYTKSLTLPQQLYKHFPFDMDNSDQYNNQICYEFNGGINSNRGIHKPLFLILASRYSNIRFNTISNIFLKDSL